MSEYTGNPYVGPQTFTEAQSHLFFGREREASALFARVLSERLVLFYAQSGAGKSSLVNACLIPRLRASGYAVLPVGRVSGALLASVTDVDNIYLFNLMLNLDNSGRAPDRFARMHLDHFLARLNSDDGRRYWYANPVAPAQHTEPPTPSTIPYLLIVDQFEEIFTHHPDRWQDRENFFRQLNQALASDPLLRVLLVLREDYVATLDPYAPLLDDRLRARFYMQCMEAEAALQAIEKPAEKYGRSFAPGVAQNLVENLRQVRVYGQTEAGTGQFVELVQLQVVCYQLWEEAQARGANGRTASTITQADFPVGYIDQALIQFYEDALRNVVEKVDLPEDQVRDWFENKLITEGSTRAIVFQGEDTGGLSNAAADLLLDQHVLRSETRAGGRWVELVHDRLMTPIAQANAAWWQAHPLIQAAREWKYTEMPENKLYQGEQLAAAWNDPDAKVALVRSFLHAGQRAQEEREAAIRTEEQSHANYRLRWLVAALAFFFVLAVGAAIVAALMQMLQAKQLSRVARSMELAAYAQAADDPTGSLNLMLAREAALTTWHTDTFVTNEALAALNFAVFNARQLPRRITLPLASHSGYVWSVAYSPDGKQIVSGSADGMVRVWNAETGVKVRQLAGHSGPILAVTYSPDGTRIASGGEDRTVQVWDAQSGAELLKVTGHSHYVMSVAYSPDGKRIASGSADQTVRVWDAQSGTEMQQLRGHTGAVFSVAYSPDGTRIASGGADQTVRVWDAQSGTELRQFTGHTDSVLAVAYSPDGTQIVSGSADGMVGVWNAETDAEVHKLTGHSGYVWSVAYSPDGKQIVSGGADWTMRVWDAQRATELQRLTGHTDLVLSVAYSPDGMRIVSGSADQTLLLWYVDIEYLLKMADSLIQRDPPAFDNAERARYGFGE
ncbi:MAG: hypothetical protein JXR84_19650 [Anaerolineae bacterium]|nr:hypothetical protein [Anaerolineae bacterium]